MDLSWTFDNHFRVRRIQVEGSEWWEKITWLQQSAGNAPANVNPPEHPLPSHPLAGIQGDCGRDLAEHTRDLVNSGLRFYHISVYTQDISCWLFIQIQIQIQIRTQLRLFRFRSTTFWHNPNIKNVEICTCLRQQFLTVFVKNLLVCWGGGTLTGE